MPKLQKEKIVGGQKGLYFNFEAAENLWCLLPENWPENTFNMPK